MILNVNVRLAVNKTIIPKPKLASKTKICTNEHYEQEKSVKEWVACENEKEFLTHPAANKFRELISAVQAVGQKASFTNENSTELIRVRAN